MKIKKLPYILILGVLGLASCENLDDRYIPVEGVKPERKVLLTEFTGQRCVNCPTAHGIIENLEEQYGEDLIVVSIHAGSNLNAIPAPAGLMQEEGNVYADYWGINAYPAGIVDYQRPVLTMDQWAAPIRNDLTKPTDVGIQLDAQLSEDGRTIEISSRLSSSQSVAGKLQLWISEDNIKAMQFSGSDRIPDYIHNNVFRACVNGTWGTDITLTPNFYLDEINSIEVDPSWDIANVNVVAFVYNDSGTLQAEKVRVALPD